MDTPPLRLGRALLRSFLLVSAPLLSVPLQSQTATNLPGVVNPIAPIDLPEIRRVLSQCLNRNVEVAEQQVRGRVDQLTVDLEFLGSDARPADRFYALLQFDVTAGQWQPADFVTAGERVFPAVGEKPVFVRGVVASREVEALHAAVSHYWERHAGAASIRITSIESSRRSELSCGYGQLEPFPRALYEVTATDSTLPTSSDLAPPPGAARQIIDIQGQLAPLYVFRLREGAGGSLPEVISVQCQYPATDCDAAVLAALQSGSSAPEDPLDDMALRAAMLAALPPVFRTAEIESTQTLWSGIREIVVVGLDEVAISPRRKASSALECRRFLREPSIWNCRQRIFGQRQEIGGLDAIVRLVGEPELTEAEVDGLVETLLARLEGSRPQMLILRPLSGGGFHLSFLAQDDRRAFRRQAWFSRDLELERLE